MVRNRRRKRVLSISSFLITATIFISLVSSAAAISINKSISVSAGDYASGYFGLTGLTQQDQIVDGVAYGGVQLIPQGALAQWQDANNTLCRRLADMGTVSYKNFLYTLGGSSASGGIPAAVAEVCSTQVIDTGGDTSAWTLSPRSLPHPLTRLSAVAVNHPSLANKGIIYTFGGQKVANADNQYTHTIYSSVINADGSLDAWQTQALTTGEDLIYTSATAYTTPNNQTYIYLVGGRSKDATDNFAPEFVRRSVRRTLVGANGVLGPWQAMPDLPITPDMFTPTNGCDPKVGLHSMDVTNFDAVTLQNTYRAFLVVGGTFELGNGDAAQGCSMIGDGSAQVMLGKLDANGMLSWETQKYVLPEPLSGPRVIGVNQKIYVVGGRQGSLGEPTHRIYSSFINIDAFTLPVFGQSNFRVSENALEPIQARSAHGLELIYINNRPVAYMFGGIRAGNTYQNDVLFGFVGTDADIDLSVGGYPSPGVYRSPASQLRAPAIIEQVLWQASLESAPPNPPIDTDIQIQYRLATTRGGLDTAQWQTVDGNAGSDKYSVNGQNVGNGSPSVQGVWFQYQALLTTQDSSLAGATPILRNVRIKYKVDGHPSLFVDSASMSTVTPAGITSFTTTIKNTIKPGSNDTENVLDADIESSGNFFVDMYILPPGSPDSPPVREADGSYPFGVAFTEISRGSLPQDASITLDAVSDNTIWRLTCPSEPANCPLVTWQSLFNQTGTWKVYLVVDSSNNVNEADALSGQRELDNVYTFNVNSTVVGSTIRLPAVGINFLAPQP